MLSCYNSTMAGAIKATIRSRRFPPVFLAVLAVVVFFQQLGSYPLFDVDEPRYAEAAREMIVRGDWVTPFFNFEPRLVKPVLFYWLIALSYLVFGVSEFAARLPSAVGAAACVGMVYLVARHRVNRWLALMAGIILATAIEFVAMGRTAITDMTLAAMICGATLAFYLVVHHDRRWWLVSGFFAGLGVLTKGPVAIVLPGAVLFWYALFVGRFRESFLTRWFPLAVLLAVAVALPWHWLAYLANGREFLLVTLENNFGRFSGGIGHHEEPIWYFIPVLLAGFFPWSVFLPATLVMWVGWVRQYHRQAVANRDEAYLLTFFGGVWSVLVFLFFSLSTTKLPTYILPMFPGLALWMGGMVYQAHQYVNRESRESSPLMERLLTGLKASAWVLLMVTLLGGYFIVVYFQGVLPPEARHLAGDSHIIAAVILLIAGAGIFAGLLNRNRVQAGVISMGIAMGLLVILAVEGIVPDVNRLIQGPMLRFIARAGDARIVTYHIRRPGLTFYTRRRIDHVEWNGRDQLGAILKEERFFYIIAETAEVDDLKAVVPEEARLAPIDQQGIFSLLSLQALPKQDESSWPEPSKPSIPNP